MGSERKRYKLWATGSGGSPQPFPLTYTKARARRMRRRLTALGYKNVKIRAWRGSGE